MKPLIVFVALALFPGTVPSLVAAVTNRVIATSGDPLPGAPNDIVFSQSLGNGMKVINSGGDVAFIGSLRNTNTGDLFNDNALVLANAGGLQEVGRTGDSIPGLGDPQFGRFTFVGLNDLGGLAIVDVDSIGMSRH